MYLLNVDLHMKPGMESSLERTFSTVFLPAISKQEGFARAALLRPTAAGSDYRLVIGFASPALQQRWVASPLHQQVWPQMEDHFLKFDVLTYDLVDG
jgi:heme-degrading monooxygenase HmoA